MRDPSQLATEQKNLTDVGKVKVRHVWEDNATTWVHVGLLQYYGN